jgi:hypothetical protein
MSAFAPSGGEPLWRVSRHPRSLRLKTNPAETSKRMIGNGCFGYSSSRR